MSPFLLPFSAPATGGWISEDPLPLPFSDENPYRYVLNTPTLYVDPSGLLGPPVQQGTELGVDEDLEEFKERRRAAREGRIPPGYTTWDNPMSEKEDLVPPSGAGVHKPLVNNGPNFWGLWEHYINNREEMDLYGFQFGVAVGWGLIGIGIGGLTGGFIGGGALGAIVGGVEGSLIGSNGGPIGSVIGGIGGGVGGGLGGTPTPPTPKTRWTYRLGPREGSGPPDYNFRIR